MAPFLFIALNLFSLFPGQSARADSDWGWQQISLHPPGGAYIYVNYRVTCEAEPNGQTLKIPEIWIDAEDAGISREQTPRVVFITKDKASNAVLAIREIDLAFRGGKRASAPYPGPYPFNVLETREELALVLGGAWQKDYENGDTNFGFSLFDTITDLAERPCR